MNKGFCWNSEKNEAFLFMTVIEVYIKQYILFHHNLRFVINCKVWSLMK